MNNITGIILAGGKSQRMGKDKAFISIGEKPLVEVVMDKMLRLFEEVIIVTNDASKDKYAQYKTKVDVQTDIFPECGPLGGIHTGVTFAKNELSFVVACDMPFLNVDLLSHMIEKTRDDDDAVVFEYGGRLQPLCALYKKSCLPAVKKQIACGNFKIRDFLKCMKTTVLNESEVEGCDPGGRSFVNINTYDEYLTYKDNV